MNSTNKQTKTRLEFNFELMRASKRIQWDLNKRYTVIDNFETMNLI